MFRRARSPTFATKSQQPPSLSAPSSGSSAESLSESESDSEDDEREFGAPSSFGRQAGRPKHQAMSRRARSPSFANKLQQPPSLVVPQGSPSKGQSSEPESGDEDEEKKVSVPTPSRKQIPRPKHQMMSRRPRSPSFANKSPQTPSISSYLNGSSSSSSSDSESDDEV